MPPPSDPHLLEHAALRTLFPALLGLDRTLQERLTRTLQWVQMPREAVLFAAGDACRGFPLLVSGEVQVMRSTPDGHEIELYRIHPGESCIVSTSCLLGEAAYPARGQALSDVVLAIVPHELFDTLIASHAPFRRYVFGRFAERLAQMMQRVEEVAFRSLTRRIAALMLSVPEDHLEITHEKLAAQIGASREAVSRALKKLEDAGCLKLARGRIDITDPIRLQAEA
ncbi:Crp/Fnr family transcriptional regulator [Thiobacillus sp.]|uniref:Crp/Fnr family transcriptional regulator n=1 Tax=Thiobacillus sp. TaxID=924 RepID=UPI00286DEB40|nr:Crp/Fnr family transcriptional regulator [Thiobacillus sp.]